MSNTNGHCAGGGTGPAANCPTNGLPDRETAAAVPLSLVERYDFLGSPPPRRPSTPTAYSRKP